MLENAFKKVCDIKIFRTKYMYKYKIGLIINKL